MNWILIFILPGLSGIGSIEVHRDLSREQCASIVQSSIPIKKHIGAFCTGPNGERITVEDDELTLREFDQ
jgi:hypothetical protein